MRARAEGRKYMARGWESTQYSIYKKNICLK